MKKLFVLLILSIPFFSNAQNVGIGTNTPDASAMLDISSNSKGLLIPRLTTLQRTSIGSPTIGLTVFDSDTYSFWVYRGDVMGGWREMLIDLDKQWGISGSNIYNTNAGNVGIGTITPQEKLSINDASPGIQFLVSGTARSFLKAVSTDIQLGTYNNNTTGSILFTTKGLDRMSINENGLVGIGTTSPVSDLTINGSNPYLQMQNSGVNKGFFQLVSNDLKLGTNSTNTTGNLILQTKLLDRMTIDEYWQVGIGTTSPTSILSINSSNPTVQLKNSGTDKGFIQLVNDDIKIGTNIGNTTGRFIVRTDGSDRFTVNNNGNATLGTPSEGGLLTVDGVYTGIVMKTGGLTRMTMVAAGLNPEITGSGSGVFRIRNNNDGMYLYSNGQISIGGGGAVASGYTVSVEGKLIATTVTSLPFGSWPDYVFEKDYTLRTLPELKEFIQTYKHLPNVPSAAEIEKEGVKLAEISKAMIEKIEELTLYILRQQEQIDELKKKLDTKHD